MIYITSLKTSARTCNTDTNASDNNNITTISDVVVDGIEIEKRALVRNDNNICAVRECEPVGQVSASMAVDVRERKRDSESGREVERERK